MFVNQRRVRSAAFVVLFAASAACVSLAAGHARAAGKVAISSDIRSYVAERLEDFSANIHLLRYDRNAARHINRDFGTIYEWMRQARGDLQLRYKEPDRMRIDGNFGPSHGTFIVNGPDQKISLSMGLHVHTSLGNSPGKRKTLLDVGLISNDYLSYTDAQYMDSRPYKGVMCAVFRISYRDKSLDTSHRLVWIDPATRVTLKREEYSQEGKLLSIWYYHDPQQVAPGIYMPSSIEIDDNQGNLAGETAYRNIRVNVPMPDSLFR